MLKNKIRQKSSDFLSKFIFSEEISLIFSFSSDNFSKNVVFKEENLCFLLKKIFPLDFLTENRQNYLKNLYWKKKCTEFFLKLSDFNGKRKKFESISLIFKEKEKNLSQISISLRIFRISFCKSGLFRRF